MDCPECKAIISPGQKYCGACGHRLEKECARCGASNSPGYKFCSQCGSSLTASGTVSLARSGLITGVDQKVIELLGHPPGQMKGKPFTLFISRADLVVFFSHWNELLSTSKKQFFEIALKHREGKSIYVRVECIIEEPSKAGPGEVRIFLEKIDSARRISEQLQRQQDLFNLIFSITDNIHTVSEKHLDRTIEDALKKAGLFTGADRCFVFGINRVLKRLEMIHQWRGASAVPSEKSAPYKSVPLARIKRAIVRLLQQRVYVVDNVDELTPSEHEELREWYQADFGAVVCHLIYAGKRPIGIIGAIKNEPLPQWSAESVALLKFLGQCIANRMPVGHLIGKPDAARSYSQQKGPSGQQMAAGVNTSQEVIDFNKKRHQLPETRGDSSAGFGDAGKSVRPSNVSNTARPMLLEKLSGRKITDQQPVHLRDDGLVLLACPRCGLRESVLLNQFEKLGNGIAVKCSCSKQFAAVLEKRRSFRKPVQLDGYFTLAGDPGPAEAGGSIWGSMMVLDLSKSGLRFRSDRAGLMRPGDRIMVRFNLDNSNHALIHKPAKVISINGDQVGCRFEGADQYDITLGFYFI